MARIVRALEARESQGRNLPLILRSALFLLVGLLFGCGLPTGLIRVSSVEMARLGLAQRVDDFGREVDPLAVELDEPPPPEVRRRGSVIVGELLAIFPGMFVHGLGHYYAGDYKTAARLFRIGEFGYLLTLVGGGAGVGAYYLEREDQKGYAYSLYATGGTLAAVGLSYFFTAWIYDMIDTPRAVRSGGQPPPRSEFVEAMDIFD
ncbi:MAG TPA: hypothetical protein VMT52_16055 [Planctomycetota bacterium]|nr:hypothetical protein [Planctomycetota bacterium]